MSSDFIALELRDRSNADMATVLRFMVDELLGCLHEAFASDGIVPAHEALCLEVARNRAELAKAVDRRAVGSLVEPLMALSRSAMDQLRTERSATRAEIAALVGLVRDAVTVVAGENDTFSANVGHSLQRFDELRRMSDIHQLKEGLTREVTALKELAREREERWKSTVTMFEERVASLERQLNASREEASVDPLTGAGNRRAFDRALEESLRPGRRQFVLAMLDLDDFKRINDTLGHEAGDGVLRAAAETLKGSLRGEDLVARIGGDEFALIISGVTLGLADTRLRSIASRLAAMPVGPDGGRFTVSCGIAECSAGDTAESLIRRADQALYDAKRQGKNRVISRQPPFIRDLRARQAS
jgi:diguanylate cyclase (GGDEF)-like protein